MPVGYILKSMGLNNSALLLCDGRAMDKNKYKELFDVIGSNYGSGPTTFNLPDFRGKVLKALVYQEFWECWLCINCNKTFSDGHDRVTWWCPVQKGNKLNKTYYPMTNLEYLEYKECKNEIR